MNLEIDVSPVFDANYKAFKEEIETKEGDIIKKWKVICNQGGTRSGKTYNIMILLIILCYEIVRLQCSVVASSLAHLKKGAIKDFVEIMKENSLYDENRHHKTDGIYTFENGSYIEFFGTENYKKVVGPGRHILFINEAILIGVMAYRQLLMRTTMTVFIDYNASEEDSYIYDEIIPRNDCKFIKSTFLNNLLFLPRAQIMEIERLKYLDDNYWKIYGLGERGVTQEKIYGHMQITDKTIYSYEQRIYGLDFGFNNPCALVEITEVDQLLYTKGLLKETKLTTPMLIERLKELIPKLERDYIIYCDHEPDRILEIQRAGFNAVPADKGKGDLPTVKGKGSVDAGIRLLKGHWKKMFCYGDETQAEYRQDIRNYKNRVDKNGIILDKPLEYNDHYPDALRMAVYSHYRDIFTLSIGTSNKTKYGIRKRKGRS